MWNITLNDVVDLIVGLIEWSTAGLIAALLIIALVAKLARTKQSWIKPPNSGDHRRD
jgi:hypothetical protein